MNSFDFLLALNGADKVELCRAIELMYPDTRSSRVRPGGKKLGRTLLIAAVVASIFAALCVGAYALNLFGIRELLLPGGYVERYQEGAALVDTRALSIQGIESSREFMAYKEFKSFYDDYTAKDYYGDRVPQEQDEEMERYGQVYFCYTRRLMDKLLETADKYGLKLRESRYDNEGLDRLGAYTGVENILELEGYEGERASFIAYNDGSFCLQNHISLGSDRGSIDTALWRSVKGYFAQGNLEFEPDRQLQERVYTTTQGLDILIVDDAASSAALFYDGPAAFVAMGLYSFDEQLTEEKLEEIAEGINFLGLGEKSQVDEEAKQPRPTPPPPTGGEMQERRNNMAAGTVDLGESFRGNPYSPVNSKLEISVEELSLSNNIYDAGWEPEQFLEYSVVSRKENGTWESISYPDYFDRESGELIDGVQLLTVKIRVSNRSEGDIDPGMGANLFANCQLHLINAGKTIRGEDGSYTDNIAYSGPWGGGQYSLVELAPGETLSYCLGYAIDDAFPLEEAWLSTVPQGIPGTYIPLGTAELK